MSSQSGPASIGLRVGGSGSVSEWMRGGMESEGSNLGGSDLSPVGKGNRKDKPFTDYYAVQFVLPGTIKYVPFFCGKKNCKRT